MKEESKRVADAITDYKRMGLISMFVSVFFYIGTLLPKYAEVPEQVGILSLASLIFLLLAFSTCWRITALKKKCR
ncbi:MAG: YrhC family protein [Sporolactobacillus sp.]